MLWETLASALLGLATASAAVRRYPTRFRQHRLTVASGAAAAFFGALLTHAVLGPGHALIVLTMGVLVCAVLLSLLFQPDPRGSAPHRRQPAGLAS
jgi:hypothetical protein